MKEIFISASDTDDNLSSVKSAIASLVDSTSKAGATLLVFDNGANNELMAELIGNINKTKSLNATIFTGDIALKAPANVDLHVSRFKDLREMKLPAQFIVISGSSSYLMLRGKEWRGYENQPESTRLALETLSRIRRLFF